MNDFNQIRARIAQAQADLAEYPSVIRPLTELLDALEEAAMNDLVTITPDKLQYKQGVLAQLKALKNALRNPGPHASAIAG